MSEQRLKKRTKRRHRRHHKRLKHFLIVLGAVSLAIGTLMAGASIMTTNSNLLTIGAIYLGLGGICMLIRYSLQRQRGAEEQSGMALMLALMLVAVLGVLVMVSLQSAQMALRQAKDGEIRFLARVSAVDAAWRVLHELAAGDVAPGQTVAWRPPGGVPARVRLSRDQRAATHGGDVLLHAIAETNQVSYEVFCVAKQQANAALVVTRWIEP